MKKLELGLGDVIRTAITIDSLLPLEILNKIQGAVSIAYLKDIEAEISRRDMKYKEKRAYYSIIDEKIREIENLERTW